MGLFVEASRSDKYHKGPLISPRVFGFDSPLHPCTYMYLVCHSCLSLLSNEDRKRRLFFLFFADLSVPPPPSSSPVPLSLLWFGISFERGYMVLLHHHGMGMRRGKGRQRGEVHAKQERRFRKRQKEEGKDRGKEGSHLMEDEPEDRKRGERVKRYHRERQ